MLCNHSPCAKKTGFCLYCSAVSNYEFGSLLNRQVLLTLTINRQMFFAVSDVRPGFDDDGNFPGDNSELEILPMKIRTQAGGRNLHPF
jgi:hypothetical protein